RNSLSPAGGSSVRWGRSSSVEQVVAGRVPALPDPHVSPARSRSPRISQGSEVTNRPFRNAPRRLRRNLPTAGSPVILQNICAPIDNLDEVSLYDSTNQVTNDSATTYTYDLNGNRTMSGYSTGTGNRMSNDGVWTYTYDDGGNLTKKSKGSSAETWTY